MTAAAYPAFWCCLACPATHETDRSAETHTKKTSHTTMTGTDPARLARMLVTVAATNQRWAVG